MNRITYNLWARNRHGWNLVALSVSAEFAIAKGATLLRDGFIATFIQHPDQSKPWGLIPTDDLLA